MYDLVDDDEDRTLYQLKTRKKLSMLNNKKLSKYELDEIMIGDNFVEEEDE